MCFLFPHWYSLLWQINVYQLYPHMMFFRYTCSWKKNAANPQDPFYKHILVCKSQTKNEAIQKHISNTNIFIFVGMYLCVYVYMYVCMYVCMYVRTYVCMYVCTYVCIYKYIYIQEPSGFVKKKGPTKQIRWPIIIFPIMWLPQTWENAPFSDHVWL